MLRIIYVAAVLAIAGFAVSEAMGLWPDRFGSVSRLNDLLGVLAILFVVLSFGALAWPSAVTLAFHWPLQREYRKLLLRAQREHAQSSVHKATPTTNHTHFFTNLTQQICTSDISSDATPARLIAVASQRTKEPALWPWELPELAEWAQRSEDRLRSNIAIRLFLSERLQVITQRLATLRGYALSFPVAPPGLAEHGATHASDQHVRRLQSRSLSSAIEAHTGASVLATGLHTRAGIDTVRLWHSDQVFSQLHRHDDARRKSKTAIKNNSPIGNCLEDGCECAVPARMAHHLNFTEHHLTSRIHRHGERHTSASRCEWEQAMRDSSYYLVGDRDSHVPIVDGVTVSENRWAGSMEFVLSTHSSCMAATDHSPFACKGDINFLHTGSRPLWHEEERVVKRSYEHGSALESNLAVHVSLVITDEHDERYLVLVRRSNTFRFGNRMLTVPGETLTLTAGGRRGYTDMHGAPDLLQHALSGVRTALGIELEPHQLRPSHVIMVNQRESTVSASSGRSQLVCTVGFTASMTASREEIRAARAAASRLSQHGVQDVEFLPLGRAGITAPRNAISKLLSGITKHAREMDQMSTTAALIVAARLLGVTEVTDAISRRADKTPLTPWWATPWVGEEEVGPRWAIDPARSRVIDSTDMQGSN